MALRSFVTGINCIESYDLKINNNNNSNIQTKERKTNKQTVKNKQTDKTKHTRKLLNNVKQVS